MLNRFCAAGLLMISFFVVSTPAARANGPTGYIHVKCEPGCTVYVDGECKGRTTADQDGLIIRAVPVGERTVKIEKVAYQTQVHRVVVSENAVAILEATFQATKPQITQQGEPAKGKSLIETGELILRSLPTDAQIVIPELGIESDKTKNVWRLSKVAAGTYDVVVHALNREVRFPVVVPANSQAHLFVDILENRVCDVNAAAMDYLCGGVWIDTNVGRVSGDWRYRIRVSGNAAQPHVELELHYITYQRRGSDGIMEDRSWDSYLTSAKTARFIGTNDPGWLEIVFEARHMERRYDVSRVLKFNDDKSQLLLTDSEGDVHWRLKRGGGNWPVANADGLCHAVTSREVAGRSTASEPGYLRFMPNGDRKARYRFSKGYLRVQFQGTDLTADRKFRLDPGVYEAIAYSSEGKPDRSYRITWQTRTRSTETYEPLRFSFEIKPGLTTVLTGDIVGEWNGDEKHHDGQWRPEVLVEARRE